MKEGVKPTRGHANGAKGDGESNVLFFRGVRREEREVDRQLTGGLGPRNFRNYGLLTCRLGQRLGSWNALNRLWSDLRESIIGGIPL